ncbi:MAG: hypothetical protein ACI9WU_001122 [Myxococcota bacterium]
MKRTIFDLTGLILVLASIAFFFYSVRFLAEREYIGGILQIFVGFSLIRAGLELSRLGLLREDRQ